MKCCGLGFRGLRDSGNQDVVESFFFFQFCLLCLYGLMQGYKFEGFPVGRMHVKKKKLQVLTGR